MNVLIISFCLEAKSIFLPRRIFVKHLCTKNVFQNVTSKNFQFRSCNFNRTSANGGKVFQEVENEYAHNVLESRTTYSLTVLKHPSKTSESIPFTDAFPLNSAIEKFIDVSVNNTSYLNFHDSKFTHLIQDVASSVPAANNNQIINILHCLCLWPPAAKTYTPNFKLLWNKLDDECTDRLQNLDVVKKLLIADYWFHLRLSRITSYNSKLIVNLIHTIDTLSPSNVIQLMFYIILQRKVPKELLLILENRLKQLVNDIDLEELSIICLAFFKTECKVFNSSIIKNIVQKLTHEVSNSKLITVSAILKFLRKSLHKDLIENYIGLMHACIPFLEKWDVVTSVHLALLSCETNVYHPILLDKVTERLVENIERIRLKDGLKFLQCASHFNHYPMNTFNDLFFKELEKNSRQDEINARPRDLVFILLFYAYINHYSYKMLTKVLDKTYVDLCILKDGIKLLHGHVELDYCVAIDCIDYDGPRLPKKLLSLANERRGNFPSSQNSMTRLLSDIVSYLTEFQGNNHNIVVRHILPHCFTPDVILRLTPKDSVKSLSSLYNDYEEESILVPPKGEIWACFVVSGIYSFAYKSKHPIGMTAMKLRQLEKLGYKVIFIPYPDVLESNVQRKNFIREKLKSLEEDLQCELCIKL